MQRPQWRQQHTNTFFLLSAPSRNRTATLPRPAALPVEQHGMQDGSKREKEWEWRGTFGVGRVLVRKRTRESFHLWPTNAEDHQHHKSEGLARLDTSSALPRIPCPMSHTSAGAHALLQQQLTGVIHTGRLVWRKPRKLRPRRLR